MSAQEELREVAADVDNLELIYKKNKVAIWVIAGAAFVLGVIIGAVIF